MAEGSVVSSGDNPVKDPRTIARKYQLELCRLAVEQNIIVYLGTGCGKTHIAVLLMHELGHLIRKPSKNVCVFLAPTIPLVQQQALVIESTTDLKVGSFFGNGRRSKDLHEWEEEIEQYEVLVMTPQILLHNLRHCFLPMELIALLIFDECHHAQAHKRHPYAQIMKEFYRSDTMKRPRIFGMTASPVIGKGGTKNVEYTKCINSLEHLLDAKVFTVDDSLELGGIVADPDVKIYEYCAVGSHASKLNLLCKHKLEQLKVQSILIVKEVHDYNDRRKKMKQLRRVYDSLIFCIENIGLMGSIKAAEILFDDHVLVDDDSKIDAVGTFLSNAATILKSEGLVYFDPASMLENIEEPLFSNKLSRLIQILSTYRGKANMRCIIFVKRIVVARALACILGLLKSIDFWKSEYIVGFHSRLRNMSRRKMDAIMKKFSSGQVNLLIATNVAEEGLDIQACCLVIRFDLPETVASFIQSRGRARMLKSEYVCLLERGNQRDEELLNNFVSSEKLMNCEILSRTGTDTFDTLEEKIYKVYATGASISTGCSISLLYSYCAKLPRDLYFTPSTKFFFIEDMEGTVCRIILPPNAPLRQVDSPPCSSKEEAKRVACLEACIQLHGKGSLSDYLLPDLVQGKEKNSGKNAEIHCTEEECPREELHESLVPTVLKIPWRYSDDGILMHFYCIDFTPIPEDRIYRKFGLFIKTRLSIEAEEMVLDLHLAHGRVVKSGFQYLGTITFSTEEMIYAEKFQEMCLKVILDRSEYFDDFVPLGANSSTHNHGSSTFYLLLPVMVMYGKAKIDWNLIRCSLSSPVFGHPSIQSNVADETDTVQMLNGSMKRSMVLNSLVYTPHNKLLFFIDSILDDINANNKYNGPGVSSYMEHYRDKFGIKLLYPDQPFLKAKQLFCVRNLLHNRIQANTESRELVEQFVELPPELCFIKIFGFSKDIGSSLSLLPSLMHRLENLLVATELKEVLSASFLEAYKISAVSILEALTTEKCLERLSLERFEVLGDAFLKYVVGRHCLLKFEGLDEGQLTRKRSSIVNNANLYELAISKSLQIYIRDQPFEPSQFFAFGRPCKLICDADKESAIHYDGNETNNVKCIKSHRWLHRKTIADVVEALIGVFLVDSGFKAALAFLRWVGIQVDFEVPDLCRVCKEGQVNMSLLEDIDVEALEDALRYKFQHRGLLVQAFIHPSYNNHSGGCYQKLEFLGDAVLEYLITSYLYSAYPDLKPGQLTDLRSLAVNNNSFAHIAVQLFFHLHLIKDSDSLTEAIKRFEKFQSLSDIDKEMLEEPPSPKVLGDLVESCLGAVLLDSRFNLTRVWEIMLRILDSVLKFSCLRINAVRELRELCQSLNFIIELPDPVKVKGGYSVQVKIRVKDEQLNFSAINVNSKTARRMAAQEAITRMKVLGYKHKSKTLEDILRLTRKKDAQLIGFDEELIDDKAFDDSYLSGHESDGETTCTKISTSRKEGTSSNNHLNPRIKSLELSNINPIVGIENGIGDPNGAIANSGSLSSKSAKSRLFEICASNYWNPPEFVLCKEEGPSHQRIFTYRVVIQLETTGSSTTFQCLSDPKPRKAAAQEHASEGAIWYLKHIGIIPEL